MSSSSSSSVKYDFTGKVALITGSSSGIGAEVARQIAHSGGHPVITGFEPEDVEAMAEEIEQITGGRRPLALPGSLTQAGFPERLVQATIDRYGRIDILVNNAGRCVRGDSLLAPDFMTSYELLMDLNVRAMFKMIHLCVPHLKESKGNIVNTASIAGLSPLPGQVLYSTSKAAVNMATKCAAADLGGLGIRVNSVCPGPIRTLLGRSLGKPQLLIDDNFLTGRTVMKRNGEPEEAANLILFLASDAASYITGSNNVVDGGYMCH